MDDVSVKIPDNREHIFNGDLLLNYGRGYAGWECWVTSGASERVIGNLDCNPHPGETPREAAWRVVQPELIRLRNQAEKLAKRYNDALKWEMPEASLPAWEQRN